MHKINAQILIFCCFFCVIFFPANSTSHAQEKTTSFILFGGSTYGYHMIDDIIDDSKIKSGIGFNAGLSYQFSKYWISANYIKTKHTYSIKTENVTLNFSDIIFGLGLDLSQGKPVTPYVHAVYALPNLQDKESDGFKDGNTFGIGGGFKIFISERTFIDLSGIYCLNKYSEFEVEETPSVNKDDVRGNHLLILGNIGYIFNLQ